MIPAGFLFLALSGSGDGSARLRAEPVEVEVGQPVLWILEVDHPPGAVVRLPEAEPVPDDSWVLLEPRKVIPASTSETRADLATTRAIWSVMSLESGARNLPTIAVQIEVDGEARTIESPPATLAVASALQPGEDAPRPIRGFHAAPAGASGRRPGIAAIGLVALVAIGAVILWRRSRRKKSAPAAAPTALDRLAELRKADPEDPEAGRRIVYALTALLRESADRFLADDRAALADPQWAELRERDERLPLGVRTTFGQVLRDSERVKYALHAPTRFALEEMLVDARNALEALASAPAPAAPRLEEAA